MGFSARVYLVESVVHSKRGPLLSYEMKETTPALAPYPCRILIPLLANFRLHTHKGSGTTSGTLRRELPGTECYGSSTRERVEAQILGRGCWAFSDQENILASPLILVNVGA